MEAEVPKGAEVSAKNLNSKLSRIESVLRKGDPTDSSKQAAFQKIKAIQDKVKGGQIDVDEILELTKSTNEAIFDLGELKRGQNQLYKIREALHDATKQYGSQNSDFLSKWKEANEAYAATELSKRVGNWARKNMKVKDYLYAASALGVEGAVAGLPATVLTVGAGAALAGTAYTAEIMKRIAQSPSSFFPQRIELIKEPLCVLF